MRAATEFCYAPIIQSRSTSSGFDPRSTAKSSTKLIARKGVFLIHVGLRYKCYRASLGRNITVDPSKVGTHPPLHVAAPEFTARTRNSNLLVFLRSEAVRQMRDGKTLCDVHQLTVEEVLRTKGGEDLAGEWSDFWRTSTFVSRWLKDFCRSQSSNDCPAYTQVRCTHLYQHYEDVS